MTAWKNECSREGQGRHIYRLKTLLLAVFAFLSLTFSFPLFAHGETISNPNTVRVAYFEYGSHMAFDENKKPSGYAVDYLNEIARYTDWEYEYVVYQSGDEALASIKQGETDILPSLHYSEERAAWLRYSSSPYCEVSTTLYTQPDNTTYAYEDFELFDKMNIGIYSEGRSTSVFEAYCKEHNIAPNLVSYDTLKSLTQALENNEVDAIATMYLGKDLDYKVLARFASDSMYFALSKDQGSLIQELNNAMSTIKLRNPYFTIDLHEKYFGTNINLDPLFTRSEYAYIESAPTLKVVYEANRAPLSFKESTTGEFAGATASLFASISQTTGLSFEYRAVETYLEGLALVEQGDADIIYGIDANTAPRALEHTDSYLDSPLAKVSRKDRSYEAIAAMPEGYWDKNAFTDIRSDKFVYYQSPEECLDAILSETANVAFLDLNVATYLLSNSRFENLQINALTNDKNHLCIGVSSQSDPRLVSILDRCVQYNSSDTMTQWISESSLDNTTWNFSDLFSRYPLEVAVIVVSTAAIILLTIGYLTWARARNDRKLNALIYANPLTGSWNLNRFQIEAARIFKEDIDSEYAILYFDISRFKTFNAVFGFAEGDRLLVNASNLIKKLIIPYENERYAHIVADEFVILLRWHGWKHFLSRFDEYSSNLNELDIIKDHAYRVIVIGGVCPVDQKLINENEGTVSGLIDCARYARESIGNKVSRSSAMLYNEDMKERDVAERKLITTAEKALRNGEFVAFYQPKVEIINKKIVGFEALVRWVSPTDGFRSPLEFIPLFEQSGLIMELDLYIYEQACKRLRSMIAQGRTPVPISCNFSRHHLRQNDLPEKLKSIADKYGVDPQYLELELTESLLIEDFDRAIEVGHRLRTLNFLISIDDFGSGYSSLGALQNLPVDVLKLDRSFLDNEDRASRGDQVILKGIIQIASQLGIKVVMEGVETLQQASMLLNFQTNDLKIDQNIIAQGFLYSCPVDLEKSQAQFDAGYLEPHERQKGNPPG